MIFTSQNRFKKNRAPTTQIIPFNGEPISRPLASNAQLNDAFSLFSSDEMPTKTLSTSTSTPALRGPMVRTIAGEGKRSCCGGAV